MDMLRDPGKMECKFHEGRDHICLIDSLTPKPITVFSVYTKKILSE